MKYLQVPKPIGGEKKITNTEEGRKRQKFHARQAEESPRRNPTEPTWSRRKANPGKNAHRRQPHQEDEVLSSDEEPTPTQPSIKIIITPPEEQENANPNNQPEQKQQRKNRGNAQNAGTVRTDETEEKRTLKQAHEARRKESAGTDNTKDLQK